MVGCFFLWPSGWLLYHKRCRQAADARENSVTVGFANFDFCIKLPNPSVLVICWTKVYSAVQVYTAFLFVFANQTLRLCPSYLQHLFSIQKSSVWLGKSVLGTHACCAEESVHYEVEGSSDSLLPFWVS